MKSFLLKGSTSTPLISPLCKSAITSAPFLNFGRSICRSTRLEDPGELLEACQCLREEFRRRCLVQPIFLACQHDHQANLLSLAQWESRAPILTISTILIFPRGIKKGEIVVVAVPILLTWWLNCLLPDFLHRSSSSLD